MTSTLIISICILLLFAYLFDISSSKTRIPSVILLLLLGFIVRQVSLYFGINVIDLSPILPFLGTVGLILIVLEGAMELEINKNKMPVISRSSITALLPMLALSFGLGYAFYYFSDASYKVSLANAIPFAIISSAIAIPSARNLSSENKEFVTYESSFSDIFGVIFFNFITLNDNIGSQSFGNFLSEMVIMIIVSFGATLVLSLLLHRIRHHIKFIPIILLVILIYTVSKVFHLPALLFILFFGLFIENIEELRRFKFIQQFHPVNFSKEVQKFRELTGEFAFLVRALFFILFGFLIEMSEILNSETAIWSVLITIAVFLIRYICLKIFQFPVDPLLYIAPRGLITILLFLSIPAGQKMELANKSMIIQVIILTALIMMTGLVKQKKGQRITEESVKH